jgi:hypothetical protein
MQKSQLQKHSCAASRMQDTSREEVHYSGEAVSLKCAQRKLYK